MDQQNVEYVGFWLRVWAALIDSVLVLAITLPLVFAIYGRAYFIGSRAHLFVLLNMPGAE